MGYNYENYFWRFVIKKYLPSMKEFVPVFAVISFLFNSWTLITFLWKLPSWILSLKVPEILSIFAYAMTTNFLESILFSLFVLIFFACIRSDNFREKFVIWGTWSSLSLIGSMMISLWLSGERNDFF